ncbi:MAG: DUF6279 family lipoprotein, partial [Ramlibacter sp.]
MSSLFTTLRILARIICLLGLAAAMAGCSAIKLGYNTLPEFAYWWLDGYVDFTDAQGPRAREDLARLQQWHRTQELEKYAELLHKVELLAPAQLNAEQVCGVVKEIRDRLQAVAEHAEPALVTLALGLAPEQLQHLERKYTKNSAAYRKEWVSLAPADSAEKRFKQVLERSEMIYGNLDEPQLVILRQQIEQSAFDAKVIFADRQRRHQDALATLRKLAGQPVSMDEARRFMRGLVERWQESPDPTYRAWQEALIQEG